MKNIRKVRILLAHCSHLPHCPGGKQYERIAASVEIKLADESLPARSRNHSEKTERHIGELIGPVHPVVGTVKRLHLLTILLSHNTRIGKLTHFPAVLHHPVRRPHAFRDGLAEDTHWMDPRKMTMNWRCLEGDTSWKCYFPDTRSMARS